MDNCNNNLQSSLPPYKDEWKETIKHLMLSGKCKRFNDITIKDSSILKIIYPFLCVITIYVCRGPLQPAFIQTLMLISPIFIIYLLLKFMKNKDYKK